MYEWASYNKNFKHTRVQYLRTADTLAAIMKSVSSVARSHVEPRTSTKTRYRKVLKIKNINTLGMFIIFPMQLVNTYIS